MMEGICELSKCTGCSACLNVCGKGAISMQMDDLGFKYPVINASLCVDCGLCTKICPVNNPPTSSCPMETYVAQSALLDDLMSSSSGGAASVFSQYVLQQGGVVYGCTGEKASYVHHIRVASFEELHKLKGSKYVQSDMGILFKQVKRDLEKNLLTLFIGTPCQVAGLRKFLRKDYDKLLVVDLVCHGVSSQQLLNDDLQHFSEMIENTQIVFRKKGIKEKDIKYGVYLSKDGRLIYSSDYPKDYYIMGFMQGLFLRESCYSCQWASSSRCSDITIADFWGLGDLQSTIIDRGRGVSAVLLTTVKGQHFYEKCHHMLLTEKRSVEEAVLGNGRLQSPSLRHPLYTSFRELYKQKGFVYSCQQCLRDDYERLRKKRIKTMIMSIPYMKTCYLNIKRIITNGNRFLI